MKYSRLPLLLVSFFVLFVLILAACNLPVVGSPAAESTAPALREGLAMAWVDGSDLFSLLCNGRWMWASITPVTNNMYSLCRQAGNCTLPSGPQEAKDLVDPTKGNQPVKIVGPDKNITTEQAAAYCSWIGGRIPTEEESKDMATKTDADGKSLYPSDDGALRCVVDNPRPMALYCQTSPYYDPTKPLEKLDHTIEPKGHFCQNGLSYVTLDIALDSNDALQSVTPQGEGVDCQTLNGNRIVCGGASNSSTAVIAGMQCNEMTGFMCQAGSTMNATGCTTNLQGGPVAGMDDWERSANGVLVPTNGVQFNGGITMSHPFTPNFVFINGVMVAQQNIVNSNTVSTPGVSPAAPACPVGTVLNLSCPLALNDPLYISKCCDESSVANGSSEQAISAPSCPFGYYFDDQTKTCISLGAPADVTCLGGYNLDPSNKCCSVSIPNGNYPGCPTGQLLDPKTGLCDSQTTLLSATSLLHTQSFDVTFPDCSSAPGSGSTPGGNGPGGSSPGCPACETYTCDPVCGCAPG